MICGVRSIFEAIVSDLVLFGSQPGHFNVFLLEMYRRDGETLGSVHQTI
jgi:hypothetical protein